MILDKNAVRILALAILCVAGCGRSSTQVPAPVGSAKPVVVVTTSTLGSLVASVGGEFINLHALVPIGASPETYEPTPQDAIALEHATLVVENGAGLETWLDKLIRASAPHARTIALSSAVPGNQSGSTRTGSQLTVNPHFWLDPNFAELYVALVARELSRVDPANASRYHANAGAEIQRLAQLDAWTRARIASIPPDQRAMIAFHDAWFYFDRRYGIRDVGSIETSPGKEPSAQELAALIALAKANHVRAVFAEPEISPKLAKQLAEDAGIKTVTNLYDDSLGASPPLDTYEGMMRHNVTTIVQALGS